MLFKQIQIFHDLPFSNMLRKTNFLTMSVLLSKIVTFLSKKRSSLWISPKKLQNSRKAKFSSMWLTLRRKTVFVNIFPFWWFNQKNLFKQIQIFLRIWRFSNLLRKTNFLSISLVFSEIVTFGTKRRSSLWISPKMPHTHHQPCHRRHICPPEHSDWETIEDLPRDHHSPGTISTQEMDNVSGNGAPLLKEVVKWVPATTAGPFKVENYHTKLTTIALALAREVVVIRDNTPFTCHWPLARIIETFPCLDGLVRVVTLKTATTTLKRPLAKLALFHREENSSQILPILRQSICWGRIFRHKCPIMELFKPEKTAYKEATIAASPPLYSTAAGTATLAHSSISTPSISINLIDLNLFHHFQPHTSHMILLPNMYIPMSFLFESSQSLTTTWILSALFWSTI